MAADKETRPRSFGTGDISGRRAKSPVTIDMEAEASAPEPKNSPAESSASDPIPDSDDVTRPAAGDQPSVDGADNPPVGDQPVARDVASADANVARTGLVPLVLAGVAGGLIVLRLCFGLQFAGLIPIPGQAETDKASADIAGLTQSVSSVDQRLTSVEAASSQSIADRAMLDDLSRQIGVADAFGTSLSDRLLSVEAAIAGLKDQAGADGETASQQMLDSFSKRLTLLETRLSEDSGDGSVAAFETLGTRIDAIEAKLAKGDEPASPPQVAAAPPAEMAPKVEAGTVSRATAIGSLRQASTGRGPFVSELAVLEKLGEKSGVAPATLAALKPLAVDGAPSRAELAAEFTDIGEAILAAGSPENPESEASGFFDTVLSYGSELVKVRPIEPVSGDDPASIVTRMRDAVGAGDFAEALSERKALTVEGQAASEAWAVAVEKRLEIDRLVDEIGAAPGADGQSG